MLGFLDRARIVIATDADGSRRVSVTGRLAGFAARITTFVEDEAIPDGTIRLTLRWRYRFPGAYDAGLEQRIRNFLGTECGVLPGGPQGKRRA